jgi:hypothetical protein
MVAAFWVLVAAAAVGAAARFHGAAGLFGVALFCAFPWIGTGIFIIGIAFDLVVDGASFIAIRFAVALAGEFTAAPAVGTAVAAARAFFSFGFEVVDRELLWRLCKNRRGVQNQT